MFVTSPLWQGLTLGLAMIVPIGAQNAFVLNQGIRRHHHLMVATVCICCDVFLISLGVFGTGALMSSQPLLLTLITGAGILFLTTYGAMALRSAMRPAATDEARKAAHLGGRGAVLLGTLAVTLLNPHVYLDTMVILGSIGSQLATHERLWFAVGCLLASFIWFNALSLGAARFAPVLSQPKVKRGIDLLVGGIMLALATQLTWQLAGQLA
ncbi:LysE/ArgO family amino acid transporter [Aeromonas simiae]|uniref:LysE/ArgO family amino acid transporter n=1 Tax=Aeromonas simiae TaxID=218936 RepID=UPI00266D120D|nr:LysE/ArgO family amino acid transporter [Aeromonas simiae]MDO2947058.1 LysE/ArgO family amino acid transporter [Aeromonas simiae]MDO2950670.1 LysE/ArgO family amino acid transporter [Aeromonas simiae]MDO2954348.1 LysE/ArgO family amino acid transporter [Aeromonas simiae]